MFVLNTSSDSQNHLEVSVLTGELRAPKATPVQWNSSSPQWLTLGNIVRQYDVDTQVSSLLRRWLCATAPVGSETYGCQRSLDVGCRFCSVQCFHLSSLLCCVIVKSGWCGARCDATLYSCLCIMTIYSLVIFSSYEGRKAKHQPRVFLWHSVSQ